MPNVIKIHVYGNGRVFLGWHHVFVVLKTNNKQYHLLEVTNNNDPTKKSLFGYSTPISIRHQKASSFPKAVEKRCDKDRAAALWYSKDTNTPWTDIQCVIDDYNGKLYCPPIADCRTFADKIVKVCGLRWCCND